MPACERIGSYLVERGAIGDEALCRALVSQSEARQTSLAEALVALGFVSVDGIDAVVRYGIEDLGYEPPVRAKTLRILVLEHGLASCDEIDAAMRYVASLRRKRLGRVLVEIHAIERAELSRALAERRGSTEREARAPHA